MFQAAAGAGKRRAFWSRTGQLELMTNRSGWKLVGLRSHPVMCSSVRWELECE
jgi:hypothetical protein